MILKLESNELIKYEEGLIKRVGNAISVTNKLLALAEPHLIPYRKKNKWGFCTPDKRIVIDCEYDKVEQFSEGVAVINKSGKYGFIERSGEITNSGLLRHYIQIDSLKEGMARACYNVNNLSWGYVDKQNFNVIEFIYDNASPFCEGLARVRLNKKYGFIDKTGLTIVPIIYDNVHSFSNGSANVRVGEKWGTIDKTGKINISIENTLEELDILTDGVIYPKIIKIADKYFLINEHGESIHNIPYDCIDNRGMGFSNELIDVERNGKWGFIDKRGIEIIPCIYDDVYPFSEGLAGVCVNEKWGFIDTNGNEIILLVYDEVSLHTNGLANVSAERNGKWVEGYIDKIGVQYWED